MSPDTGSRPEVLRALVATLPLAVYTASLGDEDRPRYISPRVEDLLGIPPHAFTFTALRAGIHEDDRARAIEAFEIADAAHESLVIEYRFVRPDGRVVWIEDNSTVVEVDGEQLAQGYLLDITERKHTERMLERNATVRRRVAEIGRVALEGADPQEVVRLSLEVLRDGIDADLGSYLEEVDGQLVVRQAFGWEAAGAVANPGTPAHDAFEQCRTIVGDTDPENPESLLARFGVRSSIAVPVLGENGRCLGVLTIHLRTREGLSEFDVSLVEQTANLISATLRHDRIDRRLRSSQRLEAVGQLAAGVAHDFNNLLQAIAGYTELAAARADERTAGYLQHVAHAAARAKELTAQLLAYSRKQDLHAQRVLVADVVAATVPMLKPLLGDGIVLDVETDGELYVFVDAAQLENALINLAANARDAMPTGGTLRIQTGTADVDEALAFERQVEPGLYATIAMADTGEGMQPDVAERIFEPFFTTKERGKGTGLGLASVVGTVRQSRGFVTVDSTPGEGTTMTVYLPLEAAA
jgi:PAS domain S-box-containing protein